jgi:hypothetical protein
MDAIPHTDRSALDFDWFPEPAGLVAADSGSGWLLRLLPSMLRQSDRSELIPAFSLIASRDGRPPRMVDLIRGSRLEPEAFVIEKLLTPYVGTLAYLMFEHGIHLEAHAQNVLFEIRDESLTGKVILRDLSDGTVSIALRIAKRRVLPNLARDVRSGFTAFPLTSAAADHMANGGRPWLLRAHDTVEIYGLRQFVRAVNRSLTGCIARYDARRVEHEYLRLWQEQAVRRLGVKPMIVRHRGGLATDEALAYFLQHVDWHRLGASSPVALPPRVQAVPTGQPTRRLVGPAYRRVECPSGDLFLEDNRPAFFRPAG